MSEADLNRAELWVSHMTCIELLSPRIWEDYLCSVQAILGARITHLDENDPVRRRVSGEHSKALGEYIACIAKEEQTRWVFGRMASIGVEFTLHIQTSERQMASSIDWTIPAHWLTPERIPIARDLFRVGNDRLRAFYSYSDRAQHIAAKNKSTGAVNVFCELVGVFWLTYFNNAYVAWIGPERFATLTGVDVIYDSGATLCLGSAPETIAEDARANCENALGRDLFVDPKSHRIKRIGQFALSWEQLRNQSETGPSNAPG
jgi:hypothetical protein